MEAFVAVVRAETALSVIEDSSGPARSRNAGTVVVVEVAVALSAGDGSVIEREGGVVDDGEAVLAAVGAPIAVVVLRVVVETLLAASSVIGVVIPGAELGGRVYDEASFALLADCVVFRAVLAGTVRALVANGRCRWR